MQAVIAGQAFHWIASAESLHEIHRVLCRGGVLAVLWNTRDTSVPWIKALDDIYDEYYAAQPDVPRQHTGNWRLPFQVRVCT